jgi:phytol kinase
MFRGMERPEDRPYTLFWMISQFGATYAVYAVLYNAMIFRGVTQWMILPLLVMAVGDGLAEPVGVAFGRHSYETVALNGGGRYRRTLEGSACVFITAVVVIMLAYPWFTPLQFIAALAVIPLTGTVMEAISPHTWDSPIMLLAMGLQLVAISYI